MIRPNKHGADKMIIEGLIELLKEEKGLFITAVTLTFVYYVFLTLAEWRLFAKAGEKSWKALIPFYNLFVSHHLIGMRHIWFVLDIIFWAADIFMEVFRIVPVWVEDAFFSIAIVLTLISEIIHIMKLCYCYTKSELFGIGLFLVPPLFSMILAYGKSEYNPPRAHCEHKAKNASINKE